MLLTEGRIYGTRNTFFPMQQLFIVLPAELLQNFQVLDYPINIGAN